MKNDLILQLRDFVDGKIDLERSPSAKVAYANVRAKIDFLTSGPAEVAPPVPKVPPAPASGTLPFDQESIQ